MLGPSGSRGWVRVRELLGPGTRLDLQNTGSQPANAVFTGDTFT